MGYQGYKDEGSDQFYHPVNIQARYQHALDNPTPKTFGYWVGVALVVVLTVTLPALGFLI